MRRAHAGLETKVQCTGPVSPATLGSEPALLSRRTNSAGWHTYGMIWKPGSVAYYIDDPASPYVTFTNPGSLTSLNGAV